MKQKNRVPLYVEPLEDRWVPATVRLTSSGLFISNPLIENGSTSITVTATAANMFNVSDHGQTDGTYNVGGNIYITGSNAGDVIKFDLNGQTYGGNLFINGMNGNDTISVLATGGGTIGGNITILPGYGNDQVGINTGTAKMTIGGSVNVTNTLGGDSFTLGNSGAVTTVGGDVTVTGDSSVTIGAGSKDVIGGNLTVNSTLVNTAVSVNLANGLFVGKNFTFNGGTGSDSVIVGSSTIAGNAAVNLGSFASLGDVSFGASAVVYGNLNVQSGSATTAFNTVSGATALTVQGSAAFNFGDGNNTFLTSSTGTAAGDINVNGNLNVTEGNGNDTVNLGVGTGTNSTVNGSVFVNLGNGTDSTGIAALVGGVLNYNSGNGLPGDILQVGGVTTAVGGNNYNVAVQFGNGDDTFTLATNGLVSGRADGGGRVFLNGIGNEFYQTAPNGGTDTATLSPFWTLSNFP